MTMGTQITIKGAVHRREPDPSAPLDQTRAFLGMISASWTYDGPRMATAAIIAVETGGGMSSMEWGTSVPCLRWIGDPPSAEVAQVVYDAIRDRGSRMGAILIHVEATGNQPELGSYRQIRRAS